MRSNDGVSRLIKALLVVALLRCGFKGSFRGEVEAPSLLFSWFLEEAEESIGKNIIQ